MSHFGMWTYCTGPGGPMSSWTELANFFLTIPCTRQLSTFVIDCLFLTVFSYFALVKLWRVYHKRRLIRNSVVEEKSANGATLLHPLRKVSGVRKGFVVTVSLTGIGSLVFFLVLLWRFWVLFISNWDHNSVLEFTFAAIQFSTWLLFAAIVGHGCVDPINRSLIRVNRTAIVVVA